ncbi:hypothetical protein B2D07_04195 [Desulfococcus multivorans]|jgi:hypothetical protein|nr:conserved uncharacterized protein [Desulfococcus multivorans]AQV00053.1 hypothetical protein B2D07_04195 [Desulfococcus multivorans]
MVKRLDREGIRHSSAYTSQEIAEAAGIPGKKLASAVLVKLDGASAMADAPSSREVAGKGYTAASIRSVPCGHGCLS